MHSLYMGAPEQREGHTQVWGAWATPKGGLCVLTGSLPGARIGDPIRSPDGVPRDLTGQAPSLEARVPPPAGTDTQAELSPWALGGSRALSRRPPTPLVIARRWG